jgi:hypothetical protein
VNTLETRVERLKAGGVRDALPQGNALAPYVPRAHAARFL